MFRVVGGRSQNSIFCSFSSDGGGVAPVVVHEVDQLEADVGRAAPARKSGQNKNGIISLTCGVECS